MGIRALYLYIRHSCPGGYLNLDNFVILCT